MQSIGRRRCVQRTAHYPSGYAEPSEADRHITDRLKEVLSQLDIRVLDHLVIGGTDVVSLAERGWL